MLALSLAHVSLFLSACAVLRRIPSLALSISTSASPVFGVAVLEPLLGPTSTGTVGLVALAINLVLPIGIIVLEMGSAGSTSRTVQIAAGLKGASNRRSYARLCSALRWRSWVPMSLETSRVHSK